MIKKVEEKKRMTVAGFLLPNHEAGVQMIVSKPPPVDVHLFSTPSPVPLSNRLGPRYKSGLDYSMGAADDPPPSFADIQPVGTKNVAAVW